MISSQRIEAYSQNVSANVAACRSYLSAATKYSERTKAVSMISLAQVLGFVVGPAIQAAVVPLGDEGVWLIVDKLKLNMYTATGKRANTRHRSGLK